MVGGCASWVGAAFGIVSVRPKMVVGDGVGVLARLLVVRSEMVVVVVGDLAVMDWAVGA